MRVCQNVAVRRYCMYVYKILHTNRYVPPPPCPRRGKSVLRVKTHASESGQMHPAICGQVIKKKMHRVSAQMYLQTTVQDGVSRIHPQLLFFCCKGTDQHVRVRSKIYLRATVQDGVSGLDK